MALINVLQMLSGEEIVSRAIMRGYIFFKCCAVVSYALTVLAYFCFIVSVALGIL